MSFVRVPGVFVTSSSFYYICMMTCTKSSPSFFCGHRQHLYTHHPESLKGLACKKGGELT